MIIKIGRDRFWVKASNLERWVEILTTLPEKIPCQSKKDIAKDYLHYTVDESGRILNADEVYGLFGVEKAKNSVTIVGCNLIKENEQGFELSDGAIKLLDEYKNNGPWEKTLAEQLLKYSLRVRSIAFTLLNGGYICFNNGYMEDLSNSYINYKDTNYYIFSDKTEKVNINNILQSYTYKILGPFWIEELGILNGEQVTFQGVTKKDPSLSALSTYLKIPMILFDYLKWIIEDDDQKYILNRQKIKEDISKETYESLIVDASLSEGDLLKELIVKNSDARGFFPLETVGSLLKDRLDKDNKKSYDQWIDHYFMTGINEGKFKIIDHEQGQPRHGRGLLDKKDYQLLKLEIID
jgi:hypothetical protein